MSAAIGVAIRPARTVSRRGAFGLLRSTGVAGMASAVVIAIAMVLAIFGPLLAPYNPELPNLGMAWVGPTGGHLLGFDFEGRDVLSRLLAGTQSSMIGPLGVVIGAMALGTVIAVIAAWRQGPLDTVISAGLDIVFAFPASCSRCSRRRFSGPASPQRRSRCPSPTCHTWPACFAVPR